MPLGVPRLLGTVPFLFLFVLVPNLLAAQAEWHGVLRDGHEKPIPGATLKLNSVSGGHEYTAKTSGTGEFVFSGLGAGEYELSVTTSVGTSKAESAIKVDDASRLTNGLILQQSKLAVITGDATTAPQASGGEHLSSGEVSSLPLNTRDFSKLLLLSAGTMTDANGAANFTQQFAVNGQRGTATVFALDGADTTDPEMGGATFSNFNVDAIEEVRSSCTR